MTPTIRAARAFLASPRSDLRPTAYGRAEALGLRARGLRPQPVEWHPSHPTPAPAPAPVIGAAATLVPLAEFIAARSPADLAGPTHVVRFGPTGTGKTFGRAQ